APGGPGETSARAWPEPRQYSHGWDQQQYEQRGDEPGRQPHHHAEPGEQRVARGRARRDRGEIPPQRVARGEGECLEGEKGEGGEPGEGDRGKRETTKESIRPRRALRGRARPGRRPQGRIAK